MKKQIMTTAIGIGMILPLLFGCADLSDNRVGQGTLLGDGSETVTVTRETTVARPEESTTPAGPVLLSQTDVEGEIFYDRYLNDEGQPKSAVVVDAAGRPHYYGYDAKNQRWEKLPDRSYRSDLFWSSWIEEGRYIDFTGSATQSDDTFYIEYPRYVQDSWECSLPMYFLTVDTIEVKAVCRVDFWFRTTIGDSIGYTDDPTGYYENKEEWLETQESYLESLGFEILTDHRYARQQEGVAIEDAELLIAGTVAQFEALAGVREDGVNYHLIAASYEHYAPEEYVDVDSSLIVPRE